MVEDTDASGYVRLKAREDSKLRKYVVREGYINPVRLRDGWFHGLVVKAVGNFKEKYPRSDIEMTVHYHGPAIRLEISKKETSEFLLSVDLVPCFQTGSDQSYFIAKRYTGQRNVSSPGLLWRQSFSLEEKALLRDMDRDSGCRHELLRIVKTIVNKERSSLGRLESYHLKTAFMHYIKEKPYYWDRYSLAKHFHGFLQHLHAYLEKGHLPHYWLPGINLLEDIDPVVVGHMAGRVKRILNSDAEMNRILE